MENNKPLPFTQTPIVVKQEKNAANYKNREPHSAEQKPIETCKYINHEGKAKTFEIIDLTNVDGEPEIFEKNYPILPGEKFVPENNKNITKKAIKTDAKSLNDARVEKRNEKKKITFKKTITAKHWKNECNKKAKMINIKL